MVRSPASQGSTGQAVLAADEQRAATQEIQRNGAQAAIGIGEVTTNILVST